MTEDMAVSSMGNSVAPGGCLSLLQHAVESCIASSVQRAKRAILTEAIEDAARYTSNAATNSEPSAPSSPR